MICIVVGARPNFVKMAPIILEARKRGIDHFFVHTGQHYDSVMSDVFFDELDMPRPDVYLGVGSSSHAKQTAKIMVAFEEVCLEHKPDLVIVGGDVNSTLACALAAAKLTIPVAHVEAGLRSFDRTMPEEINRTLTDHVSDLLFTSEQSGNDNLLREGIAPDKVHFVGNCMIDSLYCHLQRAVSRKPWSQFDLEPFTYGLVTVHRPGAADNSGILDEIRQSLREVGHKIPLIFPVHPRTRQRIEASGQEWEPVRLIEPLGYLDFLGLMAKARLILTDSGGIQEESTALEVPCITLRDNTERPITVEIGTNCIAGMTRSGIMAAAARALNGNDKRSRVPDLWDGKAAHRITDVVQQWLSRKPGMECEVRQD